ncbi:hypothetical protein [Nonomuraea sp. NPDC049695]|uniref:hypothetical protein n=1 Tax=Nonomuraea sp. NPDC049695 TaxID=3154734 RepID=UPI00343BE57C
MSQVAGAGLAEPGIKGVEHAAESQRAKGLVQRAKLDVSGHDPYPFDGEFSAPLSPPR